MSLAQVYFFICSSCRDSHRVRKFMLADNFWFSLEVAGCQRTDQPTGIQLSVIWIEHTLCAVLVMPRTSLQLEPYTLKLIKANQCLTPVLFLSLNLSFKATLAFEDLVGKQDLKVAIAFFRANALIQLRLSDDLDYQILSLLCNVRDIKLLSRSMLYI